LGVIAACVQAQYPRPAAHASIFDHADLGRHGECNLDRLALNHRKISAHQSAARAKVQRESVSSLSIRRPQNHRYLVLLKAVTASPFNP
jgi:hypothetical protein